MDCKLLDTSNHELAGISYKLILTAGAVGFLALSLTTQALTPAPDGGYPGGNTAEGQKALLTLTTGTYNTAVGVFSLESNSTGNLNTALGAGALLVNTADQNTATGAAALLSNSTGFANTANGAFALFIIRKATRTLPPETVRS